MRRALLLIAVVLFAVPALPVSAQGPGIYRCFCGFNENPEDPQCKFEKEVNQTSIPAPGSFGGMEVLECQGACEKLGKTMCKYELKSSALQPESGKGFTTDMDCPAGTYRSGTRCLKNPIGFTTFPELIGRIINIALGTLGSFALLMFIYGGFLWLTSGGSADKIGKGKDVMIWAGLGLILIFASFALVRFVLMALTEL